MAASSASLPRPQSSSNTVLSGFSTTPKEKQGSRGKFPMKSFTTESGGTSATTKKKNKKHSPFRIKVGCIVALRYRSGGNNLKRIGSSTVIEPPYAEVWTDPQPGRDENLALIGRLVRCCFPKSVLSTGDKPASTRILDGEVVSLIDYEAQWQLQRQKRRKREHCFTAVELLVDRKALEQLPFLERTDEDVDTSSMSTTEKKRQHFEEVIRGKNMVTVKVNLADASGISVNKEDADASKELIAKWVIRKRVPMRFKDSNGRTEEVAANGNDPKIAQTLAQNGSEETKPPRETRKSNKDSNKSTTLYLGDGNDPQAEQERNWRWLAGRYDDMLLSGKSGVSRPPEQLSCGMIGEVLKVEPKVSTANGKPATLATVTLRRMLLPEHSVSGRLSHHGPVEIFDDADGYAVETDTCNHQVPVEELVIISRKFERKHDVTNCEAKPDSGLNCPVITRLYSYDADSYLRLASPDTSKGSNEALNQRSCDVDVCHRCHKAEKEGSMESMDSTNKKEEKLTCHDCQTELRKSPFAKVSAQCDCRTCLSGYKSVQEALFTFQVKNAFKVSQHGKNGSSRDKETTNLPISNACVVCGTTCSLETRCQSCSVTMHAECAKWDRAMDGEKINSSGKGSTESGPTTEDGILCRSCRSGEICLLGDSNSVSHFTTMLVHSASHVMRPTDFELPPSFVDLQSLPEPSEKPVTVTKPKRRKYVKKAARKASATQKSGVKKLNKEPDSSPRRLVSKVEQVEYASHYFSAEEEEAFVPTCSRLTPYDPTKKQFTGASKRLIQMDKDSPSSEAPVNTLSTDGLARAPTLTQASRKRTRELERGAENKSTSRAARANQRRLKKGVAALGASGLQLDSLADREQQLRFDRSDIHAWGVFADEDINAGDLVIEYRGELIGNAVAEKRELEYEKSKIGSDYMFRIDGNLVCDATKQGNVARFINASCDPNCYTQIITLNGNKRIVIYAKRDIKAGEELCYDYKFPFEYDESKRIPCHCGAKDCRGFMNWDKRYVTLPANSHNKGSGRENTS